MSRFLIHFAVLVLATATTVFSQTQFTSYPVGAQETPPNTSAGWGVGRFILSADQDTLYYSLFWRIPNTYSNSHIHVGAPGVQGPPVHTLLNPNASGAHGAWAIDALNLANLLAGNLYVNVHSNIFPNGEIRAQILPNPLHPEDTIYTSALSGANEVPPNAGVGWGLGTYRLSPDQDTLYYSFMWRLQNAWNAAHFHIGFAGQIGTNIHTLGTGGATGAHGAWAIDATNLARLNIDSLYANAHSTGIWAAGEIRDQIHYNPPPSLIPNIVVSTDDADFPVTYTGMSNQMIIQVFNTGTGTLFVAEINGTNEVWNAFPATFSLEPTLSRDVTLTFSPTFTHDFIGELEIVSDDPDAPPTIGLSGTGCSPVQNPGAPILYPSGSPNAIYFNIPWDLNDQETLYAMEYSANSFATSAYVDEYGYESLTPEYHTAATWGQESAGAISGLDAETTYQVRSHAKDCTGFELVGLAAEYTTPAPIPHVDEAELVISVSDADHNDVVLRWNNVVRNADGDVLSSSGFEVYHGESVDLIDELVGVETAGEFTYDASGEDKGFFQVVPIIEDFGQPHPFIAWPPEGSTVSGSNQIIIKDQLHKTQNDAFIIYIDNVVVGTEMDDPFSENDKIGVVYGFDELSGGPHTLSVIVSDQFNNEHPGAEAIDFMVDTNRPYVEFDAEFDDITNTFYCDTVGGQNIDGSVVDIYWQNTQGQEGYGPTFAFKWEGPDSVVLVKAFPISTTKVLTENSPTDYLFPDEYACVTPVPVNFKFPVIELTCCCDNLVINTSGTSEGKYGKEKGKELGRHVTCNGDDYLVDFAFEVVITYKFMIVESGGMACDFGQDCKSTTVTRVGHCVADTFQAMDPPPPRIRHHKDRTGTEFPFDGEFGSDGYGNRPVDTGVDSDRLGKKSWYDRPKSDGKRPKQGDNYLAVNVKREAQFFARADPNCATQVAECCRQWDLKWNITICEDCTIIHTVDPDVTNEVTPNDCPALAL